MANSYMRAPRLKPLAGCLTLALAIGTTTTTASGSSAHARALQSTTATEMERGSPIMTDAGQSRWQPSAAAIARIHHPPQHAKPQLPATSIIVTNCNDDGSGSLRDIVDHIAVSGDTIDMTQLGCSTITLTSGPILAIQDDLKLAGPGSGSLFINGNGAHSLRHTGNGTLSLYSLSVIDGRRYLDLAYDIDARGGCIYSAAHVSLSGVYIENCDAATADSYHTALGGAVFAADGVTMSNSVIYLSQAGMSTPTPGQGGGIYTPGDVYMVDSTIGLSSARNYGGGVVARNGLIAKYSTLSDNYSASAGAGFIAGNTFIQNCTIAGNAAALQVGGLFLHGATATLPFYLVNSTVSGNSAPNVGGLLAQGEMQVANSTIAFNRENNSAGHKYGAGLFAGSDIRFESSIIAPNYLYYNSTLLADDIGGLPGVTMGGNNNLTSRVLNPIEMPPDTLYANPLLQPLASNGGPTLTHLVSSNSPAVDAGNNVAGSTNDQRGFPRVIGSAADIGAIELDVNGVIFIDGFDH